MFQISRIKLSSTGSALAVVIALSFAGSAMAQAPVLPFNIPAEDTAAALNDFSRQANIQILFPYDLASSHRSSAITGDFTTDQVLAQLLAGTELEVGEVTATSITLRARTSQPVSPKAVGAGVVDQTTVVVTGTHIRGGNPTSPVHMVTRKDIDQSGYSQIGDLMRSIPENFAGGQNPGVFQANAGNPANANATNASTMNLRGLGSDATLVLLNGHRLTADYFFQGADISGIPLAALQKVEIVPDGASALYGSDAVAGVANFILRRNYNGGEVSARAGATAQGGGTENTVSGLWGKATTKGYALGNLEFSRLDGIRASERRFTAGATPITMLIPSQNRRSGFFAGGVNLQEGMTLGFDALLTDRSTFSTSQVSPAYDAYAYPDYVNSYSASSTFDMALWADWKLRITAVTAGSRDKVGSQTVGQNDLTFARYRNSTTYGEFTADGTLFQLPTGPLKVAVGGGYRQEGFRTGLPGSASYLKAARNVAYVYGEAMAPLVTPSPSRIGLEELELNVSVRSEDYSDLGSSTNPKIGVRYVPLEGLTLRANWGKSFKAPSFLQLNQAQYVYLWKASSVGSTSPGTVLMTYGGNSNLKPERSTSWTFGADYNPVGMKSLALSANYFHIDYTDRVVLPVPQYWLGLAKAIYAPFVESAPSASRQSALIAGARTFYNFSGSAYDPATVIAVLHDTNQNATAQTVHGVDVSYRQTFRLAGSTLAAFSNATWLTLEQQTIVTSPKVELSGTIFNAAKFKARSGLSWQKGALSANAVVNYIGSEKDTAVLPPADVGSWTTVDANVSYQLPQSTGIASGVKLTISASNLFDKMPPRTISPTTYGGIHFDSTNASIQGRFTSVTLSKSW